MEIKCSYTKLVPIEEIKPYSRNSNVHPKDQIERLAKLIDNHGMRHPVIVSTLSGEVVAGNGRLDALKLLGVKEVPVDYQDFENADLEYAFSVSDNAIAEWAELDLSMINAELENIGPLDIELLGLKDFEIEVADKVGLVDEDSVPENVETRCKPGDLWKLGNHRLLCGDSTNITDVERLMNGEKADMVFTSPPYGVGLDYNTYNDSFSNTKQVVKDVFICVSGFVDGYICLNWGDIVSAKGINNTSFPSQFSWLPYYDEILKTLGFFLYAQRIWVKPHARCSGIWSASSNRPVSDWEYLFTWSNGGQKRKSRGNGSHFGVIDSSKNKQSDTLEKHPGAFPLIIPEKMILIHSDSGESILDPFGGSGTTLIASEKLNRRSNTMELDPKYCDVILKRWEEYTGQAAELLP